MIKKILIGVDDSKYAVAAAKYGFAFAKSIDAQVGIVNIIEPASIPIANNGAPEILGVSLQGISTVNEIDLLNVQDKISEDIVQNVINQFGNKVQVTQFNEYGSTGEGIIDCSQEFKADIIVIGTHHHSGLNRLFSGNVTEYVIRHSVIPVLVVPTKE